MTAEPIVVARAGDGLVAHFPDVVSLGRGRLLATFREGTGHLGPHGRISVVESSDGFEWFELLRPAEGTDRYLVYTRWRDEESFQAWMASQAFGQAHGGPPAGGGGAPTGAQPGAQATEGGPVATGSELWNYHVEQREAR